MKGKANYEQLWSEQWSELQRIGPLTHTLHRIIIEMLKPHLFDGARVLDVGCGNAKLLTKLSERFPTLKLCGVEVSEQAIAQAPQHLRSYILRRDISNGFSIPGDPFDIVVCSEVLEHLPDYHAALSSIAAHTRDFGHALITVPHSMRYWSESDEFAGHYRRFDYEDFRRDIEGHGLKPLRYFTWGFPVSYVYNRLVSEIDPAKLMAARSSRLKEFAARLTYQAMKLDDLFPGKRWHQLFALTRKEPEEPGSE